MKRKIFLLFFFFIFSNKVLSLDIIIIASINNQSITNYDLFLEQEANQILEANKKKIDESYYLRQIINEKIKLLELKKISKNSYNLAKVQINEFLKKSQLNISEEIKKYIIDKIALQFEWNKYITNKYARKLEINLSEIEHVSESKKLSESQIKKLIDLEKEKKLSIISSTYFNEIKKKYLITFHR